MFGIKEKDKSEAGDLRAELAEADKSLVTAKRALGDAQERAQQYRAARNLANMRSNGDVLGAEHALGQSLAVVAALDQAMKAATRRRDELAGQLDRQERGWTPPSPVVLPSLPDDRLPVEERFDVLLSLQTRLERMERRAIANATAAFEHREAARGMVERPDIAAARMQDAAADLKAADQTHEAIRQRLGAVRTQLRAVEKELV